VVSPRDLIAHVGEARQPVYNPAVSAAWLGFRSHRLPRAALAALFVVSMMQFLRYAWDRTDEMLHGAQYVSRTFGLDTATFKVNSLEEDAERAGLRRGDIVVGVNGRRVHGFSDIDGPTRRARIGDELLLRVTRTGDAGSTAHDISVPLRQFTYVGYAPGTAAYVATILVRILTRGPRGARMRRRVRGIHRWHQRGDE
jgi:hypothetical protein